MLDDSALKLLIEHGIPTVLMGHLPEKSYPSVDVDNRAAAEQAVSHLIRLGHRQIACITNASTAYAASDARLHGYQDALRAHAIPFRESLVRQGDFDPESGFRQMTSLLESGQEIRAVFVASDVVAFGAMAAIREHRLDIPSDIAVVGFDDVLVARYIEPSLTTIRLPMAELASEACTMLVGMIGGEHPQQVNVLLDARLVVRNSCGALPGVSYRS
jgi:DNA-binding LacI/PurR family transcriptional regulator